MSMRCAYCLEEVGMMVGTHHRSICTYRGSGRFRIPQHSPPSDATLAPCYTETCALFHYHLPAFGVTSYNAVV